MNQKDFDIIVSGCLDSIKKTLAAKADEYAYGDRLSNFKAGAALTGKTPESVLFGFVLKHIVALSDFSKSLDDGLNRPLQQWQEKTHDVMAYMILMHALNVECSTLGDKP